MDMDTAAMFLSESILIMMGLVVIAIGLVVINNLVAKYWKDLGWFDGWFHWHQEPARFATQEELTAIDKNKESDFIKEKK